MDKLEQQQYWQRTMAAPPTERPTDPDEPAYEMPARGADLFGEHHVTAEELKALGGQFAPEVATVPAPTRQADTRTTNGDPATPRNHPSPWRAYDYGIEE